MVDPPEVPEVIKKFNERASRPGKKRYSPPGPTRAAGGWPDSRRQGLAGDPAWERFTDETGTPASPTDVLGAIDIQGDQFESGVLRELVTDIGPYQTISYWEEADPALEEETGYLYQRQETVAQYFADTAGKRFDPKTTSNFDAERGGIDVGTSTDPDVLAYISSVGKWPADITLAPTATTNPVRPRTVAAGYDGNRKVLTVVFRDGTFYNYYGVDGGQWSNFVRARSKGKFIYTYLDAKVRGVADASGMPLAHRELLYKAARTTQTLREGLQHGHSKKSKRGSKGAYGSANTPERAMRKARARYANTTGVTVHGFLGPGFPSPP
jgi:hypothetical protein